MDITEAIFVLFVQAWSILTSQTGNNKSHDADTIKIIFNKWAIICQQSCTEDCTTAAPCTDLTWTIPLLSMCEIYINALGPDYIIWLYIKTTTVGENVAIKTSIR